MRAIKFRGKTLDDNKWVHGHYWSHQNKHFIKTRGVDHEIDVKTLGQFTGIMSTDRIEIYQHDIIKDGDITTTVEWSNSNASWWSSPATLRGWADCVIIGNIFDNPESKLNTEATTNE